MDRKVSITTRDTRKTIQVKALLDTGCTKSSISWLCVRTNKLNTKTYQEARPIYNADHTVNEWVKNYVEVEMAIIDSEGTEHREVIELQVLNLGTSHGMFIGFDWFAKHNPIVDCTNRKLVFGQCKPGCEMTKGTSKETLGEFAVRVVATEDDGLADQHIRATGTKSTQIAREAQVDKEVTIPDAYKEYADVFSKKKFDTLPERRPWDHKIHLLPGSEQDRKLKGRVYPINATEQIELEKFINENIKSGRIRPSKSPIAAPFFFVQKKDAALRLVQDYRRLNTATVKDSYLLPLIQDVINKVKNAKFFSKFDVQWGFNNVRIKEGDKWKAAFIMSQDLFKPLVMFFSLTNSPATFQHMMDDIFIKQVQDLTIIVYMDNILVFTDDFEKHRKVVNDVLALCRLHKLYLKLEKCQFEQTKIDFLGIVIKAGNVTMDPIKTNGIITYKGTVYVPRNDKLRNDIVHGHHGTPIAGHPGRHKTAELVQRSYWWPGLPGWIAKYVRQCDTCQRNKPHVGPIAAPLHPHGVPQQLWGDISVDLISPLPESQGYNGIFVCVNRLTKAVICAPCSMELSAEGTARLFLENVFRCFGYPKKITSN